MITAIERLDNHKPQVVTSSKGYLQNSYIDEAAPLECDSLDLLSQWWIDDLNSVIVVSFTIGLQVIYRLSVRTFGCLEWWHRRVTGVSSSTLELPLLFLLFDSLVILIVLARLMEVSWLQ
jgi:hypothetical protein